MEVARITAYYDLAVAPYWPQLLGAAHTDRTGRALLAADAGTGELLATLHPEITWSAPLLHVPCDADSDLRLDGRGLLLVPTFFWPKPLVLRDNAVPDRPLVLYYPIARDLAAYQAVWAAAGPTPDGALPALLGATRARALHAAATPASTTELARRTATSPATASHHAAVLRAAGLLTTERAGSAVRHRLTPLGRALLQGTG
ncbi:winged helix-turn-helix domain-containing protein [Streptomyces crystallinus]|uniref:HTH arsR-type domain-containing protein n=1 Tax=Streptomyces crystallinus TaxID=68191 RepID=A0ABN1FN86_9ACTN